MRSLLKIFITLTGTLFPIIGHASENLNLSYMPPDGAVKNQRSAVAIAEIVLSDVYGIPSVKRQKPLHAKLIDEEFWLVSGTFYTQGHTKGGVAHIKIRKKDGTILGMIHEK